MTIAELIEQLQQAAEKSPYGQDTQVIAWRGTHFGTPYPNVISDPAYDFPIRVGHRRDVAVEL